ncbi:MAG: Maf family protein [Clostridiales bacterium]|nr:Maf family protein [Clostridiales bacterium]
MRLILASKSPRRHELLALMGLRFEIAVCDAPELAPAGAGPEETVRALALQKAAAIFDMHPQDCVVGADTLVFLDGLHFGKPNNVAEAKAFLRLLQGRSHRVLTGLAVLYPGGRDVRVCETEVTFAAMTDTEIDWYAATGEPMDKAGAYGVQGPGGMFVSAVNGSYHNVMGMPIYLLYAMLRDAGLWERFIQ